MEPPERSGRQKITPKRRRVKTVRQDQRYVGDAAVARLLRRYACPAPFAVVRMRFLGELSSMAFGGSPLEVMESFWPDGFPSIEDDRERALFCDSLIGLWSYMRRHQNGVPVKLTPLRPVRTVNDLLDGLRLRRGEIADGFLCGFHAQTARTLLPRPMQDAVHGLERLIGLFAQMEAEIRAAPDVVPAENLPAYTNVLKVSSKSMEGLLTAIMAASSALGKQGGDNSAANRWKQ